MINNIEMRMRKLKKKKLCGTQAAPASSQAIGCTRLSGGHLMVTGAEIGEGEVLEMGGERTEYGQSDLTAVSTEENFLIIGVRRVMGCCWCGVF